MITNGRSTSRAPRRALPVWVPAYGDKHRVCRQGKAGPSPDNQWVRPLTIGSSEGQMNKVHQSRGTRLLVSAFFVAVAVAGCRGRNRYDNAYDTNANPTRRDTSAPAAAPARTDTGISSSIRTNRT